MNNPRRLAASVCFTPARSRANWQRAMPDLPEIRGLPRTSGIRPEVKVRVKQPKGWEQPEQRVIRTPHLDSGGQAGPAAEGALRAPRSAGRVRGRRLARAPGW